MKTLRRHQAVQRIEDGWDPISEEYASRYADWEWTKTDVRSTVDRVESWVGGLAGKRILDLGGGPGQFTVAFAQRGAKVTWHDPSRRYLAIAQKHANELGVQFEHSLGYLEDAARLARQPFDLVFNRICWYYCLSDRAFARLLYDLVVPGGSAYIDTNTAEWAALRRSADHDKGRRPRLRRALRGLYLHTGWKVAEHCMPPRGLLARLFSAMPMERIQIDYSLPLNDRVLFTKSRIHHEALHGA